MFSFSNLQGLVNDNSFLTQYLPFLEMNFGEGDGTPLQYSCLENPLDGGAWWAALHGVVKSWTRLSDFTFTFHFHALEKEMATHSSVLAWRIPGTWEPGGLPSMGSHRVRHDWSNLAAAAAAEPQTKLPTFTGSWRNQENSRKSPTSASLGTLKALTVWIPANCGKYLKGWEYQTTLPASYRTCMQVKKQQLEPYIEQGTSSKLGKWYVKSMYIVTLLI